jgi:hypothetical protein
VTAASKVADGSIVKVADLLTTLAPVSARTQRPAKLPVPAAIKDEERRALARLPEVFGRVVPTERRMLTPAEGDALVEEKGVLDTIKKMVETRMASIRTAVFNHLDVEAERVDGFDPETAPYDKDGHYVLPGTLTVTTEASSTFKRETRGSAPSIGEADLKALADDPDHPEFTHADYLAMTEQTRVFDEHRFMLHLKKRPELLGAIRAAAKPGSKTAALTLRKVD